MNDFTCERKLIEAIYRPIQRNVLIAEYCNEEFNFINLIDVYYRKMGSNAIFMFLIICFTFPILFMAISAIAEKYLSVGMQDLSKRFKLSPSLAATTLIAFANGAPDVLASMSSAGKGDNSAFIGIGALFGAFIFSSTLVPANILYTIGHEIKMPKLAVIKELSFYSLAVVIVCIFGVIQTSGFPFVIVYLIVYAIYIFVTIKVDRIQERQNAQNELENSDLENNHKGDLVNDAGTSNQSPKVLKVEEAQEEQTNTGFRGKYIELTSELIDEEAGFYQNAVMLPLMLSGLFTISYLSNPLMKTHLKFLVIPITFAFTVFILELTSFGFIGLFITGIILSGICIVLEYINFKKYLLETIYEILAVFAAIAWIKIFSTFIIDFITFLAIYFSIDKVVLSTLLLSAGNSLGDFFGNAALAIQGETVMAAMACYSGQIFNNFVGLTANVLVCAFGGNIEFDIFGITSTQDHVFGLMPVKNLFIVIVILFVAFILAINFFYYFTNNFVLRKSFGNVLLAIYAAFFVVAISFALFL